MNIGAPRLQIEVGCGLSAIVRAGLGNQKVLLSEALRIGGFQHTINQGDDVVLSSCAKNSTGHVSTSPQD